MRRQDAMLLPLSEESVRITIVSNLDLLSLSLPPRFFLGSNISCLDGNLKGD